MVLFKCDPVHLSYSRCSLYIPIWFYSNRRNSKQTVQMLPFTFQYGSIQMRNRNSNIDFVSILYIPIWFYSNHLRIEPNKKLDPTLHSNMVLFKWDFLTLQRLLSITLHSNMVLFKLKI